MVSGGKQTAGDDRAQVNRGEDARGGHRPFDRGRQIPEAGRTEAGREDRENQEYGFSLIW